MLRFATFTIVFALLGWPASALAGAWTQPRGELWIKLAGFHQRSDEFFASEPAILADGTSIEAGDRRPFDEDGETKVQQLWLDLEYGLTDRWSLGVQLPYKRIEFEDRVEQIQTWGWGDARASVRYAILTGTTRLTLRTAFKAPTGRFSTRRDRLPIGENQADLELGAQIGRGFGRPLTWANLEGGRRLRFRDDEFDSDPGDEWFASAEIGVGFDRRGRTGLKLGWQSTRGDDESLNFFAPGTALARDLDQLDLVAMIDTPLAFFELGVGWVLGSETYPAAPTWSLGFSRRIQLHH